MIIEAENLLQDIVKMWEPIPELSGSAWADEYAYLSAGSSHESGKWKCLPYQREILDCMCDDSHERVTVRKSARVGYTKLLNHTKAYHIHYKPAAMLHVQPTVEDARGYSKDEIDNMLKDTPCLAGLVGDENKEKDKDNTILKKIFPGGFLAFCGANSPRGFRRISVKVVMFDEPDGYPISAGIEGDQIKLGIKRTEWFWDRKIIMGSTPTTKDLSRIEREFLLSDQRYYNMPCPWCDNHIIFEFGDKKSDYGFKWEIKKSGRYVYYLCPQCHQKIHEYQKYEMVENGLWVAAKPNNYGHAGFHIWTAYSPAPNASWSNIVKEFMECKDDTEQIKVFTNTTLGLAHQEKGTQPEWENIAEYAENYAMFEINDDIKMITAGVDTQDDRLAICIHGWGINEENWLLYWGEIYEDENSEQWKTLDTLLKRKFVKNDGTEMRIVSAAVDTAGHRTHEAYNYCRKRKPVVMAIIGAKKKNRAILSKPTKQDINYKGRTIKNGIQLWQVGTDTAKNQIYKRLNENKKGRFHFPMGLDNEFYKQLTAEKRVVKFVRGKESEEYIKLYRRNEVLDCYVYSYAAAVRAGLVRYNEV